MFIYVFTNALKCVQGGDAPGIYRVVRLDLVDHPDHGMD